MISEWREDQMQDLAFDIFLDEANYQQTENAIFDLVHKAFLEGFKAGKMAAESMEHMAMYYKGRIEARMMDPTEETVENEK